MSISLFDSLLDSFKKANISGATHNSKYYEITKFISDDNKVGNGGRYFISFSKQTLCFNIHFCVVEWAKKEYEKDTYFMFPCWSEIRNNPQKYLDTQESINCIISKDINDWITKLEILKLDVFNFPVEPTLRQWEKDKKHIRESWTYPNGWFNSESLEHHAIGYNNKNGFVYLHLEEISTAGYYFELDHKGYEIVYRLRDLHLFAERIKVKGNGWNLYRYIKCEYCDKYLTNGKELIGSFSEPEIICYIWELIDRAMKKRIYE